MSEGRESQVGRREKPGGRGVPRWPAALALLLVGVTYATVSDRLTLGPSYLLLGFVVVLLALLIPTHVRGYEHFTRLLALLLVAAVTVAVAASTLFLVTLLPHSRAIPAPVLLRDAALIWAINIVTFAVWYWEVDGGGPAQRRRDAHWSEDFLFPQMALKGGRADWSPDFLDYLFLAFNTSTAFSPTDTAVLSKRAKTLTMVQALLSLLTVAVLAARAINAL